MPPRSQLYDPVPDVNPKGPRDPSERVHIDFPEVKLSTGVVQAMQTAGHMTSVVGQATGFLANNMDRLGKQIEGAGDEIFKRAMGLQELENETAAKKASIEYDTWATQKQVDFAQLQGDAANGETLKAHMDELKTKQAEMKAKLGNQSTQRHFDDRTLPGMVSKFGTAAAHAAKETRTAANGASEGRIKLNMDAFGKTDDVKESQRIIDETYKEFYGTRVPLMGWPKDKADEEWRKITSTMYAGKITRYSEEDGQRALKMLEENKQWLTADDYDKVLHSVTGNLRAQQSRNIADRVQQADPDKPYEKKLEEVRKEAERINPKDPLLPDAAEQRLTVNHNQHNKEIAERKIKNFNSAKEAVYGYNAPGGKKPTKIEEAEAIPGFKEAYGALPPTEKHVIDRALLANSKEDYQRTPETRKRVNELKAMASSERPEDREAFMKHNFYDEKIPGEDRDALFAIQRRNLEKGYKPAVEVNKARQAAIAVGKLPDNLRTWQSPTIRNQFDGALQTALDEKAKEKKGVPLTDKERVEIVTHLLAGDPSTGFHGWFMTPRYQKMRDAGSDDLATLKQRYPGLSDNQLDELYSQIMWKKYNKEYEEITTVKPTPSKTGGPKVPTSQ